MFSRQIKLLQLFSFSLNREIEIVKRAIKNESGKPSFVIVGAQKAGTTSLYDYICKVSEVRPALVKEVHYFDKFSYRSVAWYEKHFPKNYISGEATPYYLFDPSAAARICTYNQKLKIIVVLREPVSRAISHYYHEVKKNREKYSIEEALFSELNHLMSVNLSDYMNAPTFRTSYLARGLYTIQLQRFFHYFGQNNVLVLNSRDMQLSPLDTISKVCSFIEVKMQNGTFQTTKKNVGVYNDNLSIKLTEKLHDFFEAHNASLFELIGCRSFEDNWS